MSSADINKIAGALLTALLTVTVIGHFGNALIHPQELEEAVYRIDIGETVADTDEEEEEEELAPITPLLAGADVAAGEKLTTRRCGACHGFNAGGPNKVGPNLHGIVGRDVAAGAGFSYSDALAEMSGAWGYEELNGFILKPKDYAPGTKMAFAGLKKEGDRALIIAYLRSISDAAPPLPAE